MHAGVRIALGALAIVVVGTAAFSLSSAPRDAVPGWLALVLGSAILLAIAGVALSRAQLSRRAWMCWIVGGAIALRAAALCAPVSLSDDVYRYAWDGSLVLDGADPFAHRPSEIDATEVPLSSLNSPEYYSVYPPLAQALFALAVLLARITSIDPTFALRLLFVLAELGAVVLLIRMAPRPRYVLLYAWCPLAYWEVAAGAHTEALMLPFLALAALAAIDQRPIRAGLFLGLAASAKLTALVLLPLLIVYFLRRDKKSATLAPLSCLAILAAGFLPFASAHLVDHVGESLALYQRTFSFNAPFYYGARFLFGYREGWNQPVDDLVMPLLGVLTLAWVAFHAHRQDGSPSRLIRGLALTYLGYLLLSRVVHPWYLLPPLMLGALVNDRAIALFAVLSLASYLRYHLGVESPLVLVLPCAALLLYEPAVSRQRDYAEV